MFMYVLPAVEVTFDVKASRILFGKVMTWDAHCTKGAQERASGNDESLPDSMANAKQAVKVLECKGGSVGAG